MYSAFTAGRPFSSGIMQSGPAARTRRSSGRASRTQLLAIVQEPDGYLYALTEPRTLGTTDPNDTTSSVVYRIEPAN
jgi:hypothetical protein